MESDFLILNCPNCHGELRVFNKLDKVTCLFCGNEVVVYKSIKVNEDINPKLDIQKALKLAKDAEKSKNYEVGYKYWSQIIENDPKNVIACFGKARCAIWGVSKHDPIKEAILLIVYALSISINQKKELCKTVEMIKKATEKLSDDFINQLISIAQKDDSNFSFSIYKSWNRYLFEKIFPSFLKALEYHWSVDSSEKGAKAIMDLIEILWKVSKMDFEFFLFLLFDIEKKYPDSTMALRKKFVGSLKLSQKEFLGLWKIRRNFYKFKEFRDRLRLNYKFRDYLLEEGFIPYPRLPRIISTHTTIAKKIRILMIIPYTKSYVL